ncbi:MAG: hypothetical protein LBG21_00330 [Campylobacteraceae bacterium]|jgi:predicted Zn-dependent protease|nr:hypothetical protein [Campylobacteraceae bacterium]
MKIALCVSGQIRNLNIDSDIVKLANILKADVFISTWDKGGATSAYDRFFPNSSIAKLIIGIDNAGRYCYDIESFKKQYPNLYNLFYLDNIVSKEHIISILPNIIDINIEHMPDDFDVSRMLHDVIYPKKLLEIMPKRYMYSLPMFYKIWDANRLKSEYENKNDFKYDCVIRTRTDIKFDDIEKLIDTIKSITYKDNEIGTTSKSTGKKDNPYFFNDSFAIGSSKSMDEYASIFTFLNKYWDLEKYPELPLDKRSAESLLGFHIKNIKKLTVKTIESKIIVLQNDLAKPLLDFYNAFNSDILLVNCPTLQQKIALAIILKLAFDKDKDLKLDFFDIETVNDVEPEYCWTIGEYLNKHKKDRQKALLFYKKAHEFIYPYHIGATIDYSICLNKNGCHDEAIKILNSTTTYYPNDSMLYRELGVANFELYRNTKNNMEASLCYLKLAYKHCKKACELSDFKNNITVKIANEVKEALDEQCAIYANTKKIYKIALCVSGQLRNFEATWEKSILNLFANTKTYDLDIYLDIWNEIGATTALDRIIPSHYLYYLIGELTIPQYSPASLQKEYPILKNYLFKKEVIDNNKLQKVFNTTYINIEDSFKSFETEHRILNVTYPIGNAERNINCLPMFYKIYKCNAALIKSGKEYDFVIRMRPDFFLEKEINISWEKIQNKLHVRQTSDGHCDDQFAIATQPTMNVYASLWNKLPEYWHVDNKDTNRLTSGVLLAKYLSDNNIEIAKNNWPQMISSDRIQNNDLFLALVEQVEYAGHASNIKPIINFASEVYCEILMQIVNVSKDKLEALKKIESYISSQCLKYKWMDLWQCKAFVSERKRDLYAAVDFYTQALKNDPYSFYSYSGLARCYRALNKNKLSHINYVAAHQIRSRDFFILRDFVSMLFELRKYDEALYYAQRAYALNNQNKQLEDIMNKIKQFI